MTWTTDSHRIGIVSAVDSEQLVIELDSDVAGLVKAGASGVVPIGTINSYITVAAGSQRLVAVVTGVRFHQDSPRHQHPLTSAQPEVARQLEAVMVGRFDGRRYLPGIATYPSLFTPVSAATAVEVSALFAPKATPSIPLGEAVVAPGQDVVLDINALLARHCAVLGSTGAGKSCSIAAVLDGILELDVPHANIVILDPNGEYAAAFAPDTERGRRANALILGPELGKGSGLYMPHWFMNNEDHLALLQAGEGVQAPLLQRAVADARLARGDEQDTAFFILNVRRTARSVRDMCEHPSNSRKPQETLAKTLDDLAIDVDAAYDAREAEEMTDATKVWERVRDVATRCRGVVSATERGQWDVPITLSQRTRVDEILSDLDGITRDALDRLGIDANREIDFDVPRYYSLEELYEIFLPRRIDIAADADPRMRNYAAGMMLRLSRLLADRRYDFMTRVDPFPNSLARFLRLLLGCDPGKVAESGQPDSPWTSAYEQRVVADPVRRTHSVTVVDLSLVASDVLEDVTALLARLVFEFAQRIEPRGSFPVLLVLEEAHRFIPGVATGRSQRSSAAFERIAKEGRKFGVALLLASQRPSELSRTVLSQCGTLIAHRVVNPDDQDLIRHATPFAAREVLRQLPGLATQHAIVLGEAVQAPMYVRIRSVSNPPRSKDPDFVRWWQTGPPVCIEDRIEAVASAWEQGTVATSSESPPSDDQPVGAVVISSEVGRSSTGEPHPRNE